MEKVLIQFDKF
jgi:hypothetical protein